MMTIHYNFVRMIVHFCLVGRRHEASSQLACHDLQWPAFTELFLNKYHLEGGR